MTLIKNGNKVEFDTLKTYDQINGFEVMRELLLHRGVEICSGEKPYKVRLDKLVEMALIVYGLKVNPTNKLYVDYALTLFYKRNGYFISRKDVEVPVEIYNEIRSINDKFMNSGRDFTNERLNYGKIVKDYRSKLDETLLKSIAAL